MCGEGAHSPPPPPPTECLLGIQATSGVLALRVGGFLRVTCQEETYKLINYQEVQYVDYQGNVYVEKL